MKPEARRRNGTLGPLGKISAVLSTLGGGRPDGWSLGGRLSDGIDPEVSEGVEVGEGSASDGSGA